MSRSETEFRIFPRFPVAVVVAACICALVSGAAFAGQAGVGFSGYVPQRVSGQAPGIAHIARLAVFTDSVILPVEGAASVYTVRAMDGGAMVRERALTLPGGAEGLVVSIGASRKRRIELCNVPESRCVRLEIVRLD